MNRREFSTNLAVWGGLAALGGGTLAAGPAAAQGAPVAGAQYKVLSPPVPMSASGKVEVVEFFSYACPHCFAFEPVLEPWVKALPKDVAFRRIPVFFGRPAWELLQTVYYALEAGGQVDALHSKVFNAIHVGHKNFAKDDDVAGFMATNGVDGAKFVQTMKSFSVQTKVRQAKQLAEAFQIEGVPCLGVQGRWTVSSEKVGSHEHMLGVTDYLIGLARKSPA